MKLWAEHDPLVITAADGMYLIDSDGNRYLDGVSSLWCNVHGHRVPEIDAAIRAQLDKVAHTTMLGLASAGFLFPGAHRLDFLQPGQRGGANHAKGWSVAWTSLSQSRACRSG
jgi:adenosylmethionine-8-amino-7-oxononanoate aminotransferase